MKRCSKCNLVKDLIWFSRDKYAKDRFCHKCKECRKLHHLLNKKRSNKIQNIYDQAHKLESSLRYFSSHEERKAIQLNYRKNHKKEKSDYDKVHGIGYRKFNKAQAAANTAKYRAAKIMATPNWLSPSQLKEIECFYLLSEELTIETGIQHHVDHIIPLRGVTVRGLHVPWNLRVIAGVENLSKNNQLLPNLLLHYPLK